MTRNISAMLDVIQVASPCDMAWDEMQGDDRVRACDQCQLNVYNLSGMTRADAEQLLQQREGRLCVRYFRRHDGTVITQDCPVGLRALRLRFAKALFAAVALLVGLLAGTVFAATQPGQRGARQPFAQLIEAITPTRELEIELGEVEIIGDIAITPPNVTSEVVVDVPFPE